MFRYVLVMVSLLGCRGCESSPCPQRATNGAVTVRPARIEDYYREWSEDGGERSCIRGLYPLPEKNISIYLLKE